MNSQDDENLIGQLLENLAATQDQQDTKSDVLDVFKSQLVADESLDEIFELLQRSLGHFNKNIILDLLYRRIKESGLASFREYLQFLEKNAGEYGRLRAMLLVRATDPLMFGSLIRYALEIFMNLRCTLHTHEEAHKNFFRVWVVSAGIVEDAYAMGIAWSIFERSAKPTYDLKLLATTMEESSIQRANFGVNYRCIDSSSDLIPADLLGGWAGDCRILPQVRNRILFSCHDVLNSPPFTRLDLIVCRDVLPLFDDEAKRRILSNMNSGLLLGGLLLLGENDQVIDEEFGFAPDPLAPGLYRKTAHVLPKFNPDVGRTAPLTSRKNFAPTVSSLLVHHRRRHRYSDHHRIMDLLIDQFFPNGVLIDQNACVLQIFGQMGGYFEPLRDRRYSSDLREMIHHNLRDILSEKINQMFQLGKNQYLKKFPFGPDESGIDMTVSIDLRLLRDIDTQLEFGALFFHTEQIAEIREKK